MRKRFAPASFLLLGLLSACGQSTTSTLTADAPVHVNVKASLTGPAQTVNKLGGLSINLSPQSTFSSTSATTLSQAPRVTLEFDNGEAFSYENIGGYAIVDEDVIYAKSNDMPILAASYQNSLDVYRPPLEASSTIGKRGYICTFRLIGCWAGFNNTPAWPNGKIYFNLGGDLTTTEAGEVRAAYKAFNLATGNKPEWIEGSNPNGLTTTIAKIPANVIGLQTDRILTGLSLIGYTQQQLIPRVFIVEGHFNINNITHEMGHTAGLNHEHQRCDRDNYLKVSLTFFDRYINFANWSPICNWGEDVGKFNFNSIMLYNNPKITARTTPLGTKGYYGSPTAYNTNRYSFDKERGLDVQDVNDGLRALYP